METKQPDNQTPRVNPGYAYFQIARALTTSEQHEDAATHERAQQKVAKWAAVLEGILNGTLDVGSRTPLGGAPAWATLEVITGGFATGELLAGGPLLEHEQALLAELSSVADLAGASGRTALNGYYLTEQGLGQLSEYLRTGNYNIDVPEEGALLVVAWLVANGHAEEARALLDELGPYFPRLRFYPIPAPHPAGFGSRVYLQTVGRTMDDLQKIKPNQRILAQKEAIEVWAPLYDQIVHLFLETVEGAPPTFQQDAEGRPIPLQNGGFAVEGGWPCQFYPEGWQARAQKTLDDYSKLRTEHPLCGKPDRAKDNFAQLRAYMGRCIADPKSLTGRDIGRIRLLLARYIHKRGVPDSARCKALRESQAQQASAPTFQEIAQLVVARLDTHDKARGLDDLHDITQPVTADEAQRWQMNAGTLVPESQQRKVQRCLIETIDALVKGGIITSSETLARVLPQMTSGIQAAGITDPALRQLYGAISRAFRRRRSLLLLNLESQIKLEELPWVAAVDRFRRNNLSTRELARQTLEEATILAVTSFPHAILPNKLLQELRALAKGAELDLPLVDEIAADIFMGEFSPKFLEAAKRAAVLLEGTLYERYYGIDYKQVRQMGETKPVKKFWQRHADAVPDPFVDLCSARAGVRYQGWDPATNGMIIEQQQILTTQNLGVLFDSLQLATLLHDQLDEMARRCFIWICRRQQMKIDQWHARLIMLKNTAYAWRQMIFFLALLAASDHQSFVVWAEEYLKEQNEEFQARFHPAFQGLVAAAEGRTLNAPSAKRQGAMRFMGWSKTRHWLLA